MREKIEEALKHIRPALQADGGDIELVSIEGGVVKVVQIYVNKENTPEQ